MKYLMYGIFMMITGSAWSQISASDNYDLLQDNEPLAFLDRPSQIRDQVADKLTQVPPLAKALGCDTQLFLTENPIIPNSYEASEQIIATGVVQTGTVSMRAGQEVLLEKAVGGGFEIKVGATLEITIGPCTL